MAKPLTLTEKYRMYAKLDMARAESLAVRLRKKEGDELRESIDVNFPAHMYRELLGIFFRLAR